MGNPWSGVHELFDRGHEIPHLTIIALFTTREVLQETKLMGTVKLSDDDKYLASKLGWPDIQAKSVVHLLEICDHLLWVGTVPMKGKTIKL